MRSQKRSTRQKRREPARPRISPQAGGTPPPVINQAPTPPPIINQARLPVELFKQAEHLINQTQLALELFEQAERREEPESVRRLRELWAARQAERREELERARRRRELLANLLILPVLP